MVTGRLKSPLRLPRPVQQLLRRLPVAVVVVVVAVAVAVAVVEVVVAVAVAARRKLLPPLFNKAFSLWHCLTLLLLLLLLPNQTAPAQPHHQFQVAPPPASQSVVSTAVWITLAYTESSLFPLSSWTA